MGPKTFFFSVSTCVCLTLLWLGYRWSVASKRPYDPLGGISQEQYDAIEFLDNVESNQNSNGLIKVLEFIDTDGESVSLADYKDKKNLVVVFTRGFSGRICPYCTTQTSRLIANYDEFLQRDTEVLLIYPGSTDQLPQFKQAGLAVAGEESILFPILLDLDLEAVNTLKIAAQLAKPSTFVINKQGNVVLSYVGSNPGDRPSIKAMLNLLDNLQLQSQKS